MSRPKPWHSDWRVAILVLTALWLVIYIVGLSTPVLLDDADSIHAEAAREMVLRHEWVTLYSNVDGKYHKASTLNFYLGVPPRVLHEPSGNLWYGAKFPDAPHVFETPESFAILWNGPTRVFLWTDQRRSPGVARDEVFPAGSEWGEICLLQLAAR